MKWKFSLVYKQNWGDFASSRESFSLVIWKIKMLKTVEICDSNERSRMKNRDKHTRINKIYWRQLLRANLKKFICLRIEASCEFRKRNWHEHMINNQDSREIGNFKHEEFHMLDKLVFYAFVCITKNVKSQDSQYIGEQQILERSCRAVDRNRNSPMRVIELIHFRSQSPTSHRTPISLQILK